MCFGGPQVSLEEERSGEAREEEGSKASARERGGAEHGEGLPDDVMVMLVEGSQEESENEREEQRKGNLGEWISRTILHITKTHSASSEEQWTRHWGRICQFGSPQTLGP